MGIAPLDHVPASMAETHAVAERKLAPAFDGVAGRALGVFEFDGGPLNAGPPCTDAGAGSNARNSN